MIKNYWFRGLDGGEEMFVGERIKEKRCLCLFTSQKGRRGKRGR